MPHYSTKSNSLVRLPGRHPVLSFRKIRTARPHGKERAVVVTTLSLAMRGCRIKTGRKTLRERTDDLQRRNEASRRRRRGGAVGRLRGGRSSGAEDAGDGL